MDNNNNTVNNIALDPNQMAPQDGSPLVQTSSTQPAVLDITPKDPLSAPLSQVAPVSPIAPVAPEPLAPPSQVVDITPPQVVTDPLSSPVPTPPIAVPDASLNPVTSGGSLADIISSTNQVAQAPQVVTDPLSTPLPPTAPVATQSPLAEDPNSVNTIG